MSGSWDGDQHNSGTRETDRITLKGLSDQIHAVDLALERALEILRDVNSDENELAGAVAASKRRVK